jgi:hypothetical protein
MKKSILFVFAAVVMLVTTLQAQPPGGPPKRLSPEQREKMESMKAAFITTKLDLTTEESTAFWPVYNKYQDELLQLRENRFKDMKEVRENKENLTDKDYEKVFDSEMQFRQAELDIMKKYNPQLKKTLPMKKLAKLHRAEEAFKRELLDRMKERREERGEGARRGPGR